MLNDLIFSKIINYYKQTARKNIFPIGVKLNRNVIQLFSYYSFSNILRSFLNSSIHVQNSSILPFRPNDPIHFFFEQFFVFHSTFHSISKHHHCMICIDNSGKRQLTVI